MTDKKKPNKGGRPTKYSIKILEKTEKYLKEHKSLGMPIPTKSNLADYLGLDESTLYDWNKKHDEFTKILEKLESRQKDILLANGLTGEFNSAITKLVLHKHGYHERIEQSTDITSKGEAITGITREIIKS